MTDKPNVDQLRQITPVIPENHELEEWKGVYFHQTSADRAIPILFNGLWSVSFSRLRGVNNPIEMGEGSPVQEQEGWEWISVSDSDGKELSRLFILPAGDRVTFVIKKLPFKTKETSAERKMPDEKLIKWRVRPKDLVALWVPESFRNHTVSSFVETMLSQESLSRLYKQFKVLSYSDKKWHEKMLGASSQALDTANTQYPGANYQAVGQIAKDSMTRTLILGWLSEKYGVIGDTKMEDLLKKVENDSGVKIYMVTGELDSKKTIPIQEVK